MTELLARVEAALRRPKLAQVTALRYADLEVDLETRGVRRAGRDIELSAREFDLLVTLVRHPLRVFSRDQLLGSRVGIRARRRLQCGRNVHLVSALEDRSRLPFAADPDAPRRGLFVAPGAVMLRSLSARLVLLYVLSATLLIVLVGGAVTFFALASFGRVAQQAVNNVAREVPQVAREEMQGRSLEYAAPDIVRRLAQPGLRICRARQRQRLRLPARVLAKRRTARRPRP